MTDPQRGEIWRARLEPTEGDEMRKTRPVVIVNDNQVGRLRLRIIVPITDWDERYAHLPWMVRLWPTTANGLTKPSAADAFQVRSISLARLADRLGSLTPEQTQTVADAVALCVRSS